MNPWIEPCVMCMPPGAVTGFVGSIYVNGEVLFESRFVRLKNYPTNDLQQVKIANDLVKMAREEYLLNTDRQVVNIRVTPIV